MGEADGRSRSGSLDIERAAYDTVAESYARLLPDTGYESDLDLAMVRRFVESIRERGGDSVLDAGCGAGRMVAHLAGLDDSLTIRGVDLSPGMLAVARRAHPEVVFVEGELAELPVGDDEVDGVLAWYSIIHTAPEGLPAVFSEFARVLRPGGSVLVGFQRGAGERWIARPYGHDVELSAYLHDTAGVAAALVEAGFAIDTVLDREPRPSERLAQASLLATRPAR
ncbi:class I SAM-dependent methyltransferase [Herbiconiux sp. P15]|uniref:class I SAM-dependent DNA methyltransferase n=1 Tax=Herbiconiux liukaitaii TaxID=3342799 RepID=UPI0035B6FECF